MLFLGLDGEMSDSELRLGAKLIQIGAYHPDAGLFCANIGWPETTFEPCPDDPQTAYCTEKALSVCQFTPDLITAGPAAGEVDETFRAWLLEAGAKENRRGVVPIGFNVGAFDLPFVQAHLPASAALVSRRTIDLNAVVLTMAGSVPYNGSAPNRAGWKRLGKKAGRLLCEREGIGGGVTGGDHDAGYDAAMAYGAWEFYRAAMTGNAPYLD